MVGEAKCTACLGTALVERNGSERRLTGDWCTWEALMARFKPCPFCGAGEKEAVLWKEMKAQRVIGAISEGGE